MRRDVARRLAELEIIARNRALDNVPIPEDVVNELAAELEMTPDAARWELQHEIRRLHELGPDGYDRACAEEAGMTLEEWRTRDHAAAWEDYKRHREAMRARQVTWRAGVKYRGAEPVTD